MDFGVIILIWIGCGMLSMVIGQSTKGHQNYGVRYFLLGFILGFIGVLIAGIIRLTKGGNDTNGIDAGM